MVNRRRFFSTLVAGIAVGAAAPARLLAEGFTRLKASDRMARATVARGLRRAV
jgi:hypothetical protein